MKEIDVRGLACPLPLIELKKALKENLQESEYTVITDDATACQNITDYLVREGRTFSTTKENALTRIMFKFTDNTPTPVEPLDVGDYIVVIASEEMGAGEPDLGRLLMRSFINALDAQDQLPDRIILYNRGVLLCRKGTDTGESLLRLEKAGVKITLCGTCTDYFNCADERACGSISNLLSITTWLRTAKHIIKP